MRSESFTATPKFDASTAGTSTPTPSVRHVLENKEDPRITLMKPIFDNDYKLTNEDVEAAVFIRGTFDPVEVALIRDIPLTVEKLKRNLTKGYIYNDVNPLYSSLHQVLRLRVLLLY